MFVGIIAGLGLGSVQSASRALVGLFSPSSKNAEFFGLWGFSTKLASLLGIVVLGALQLAVGLQASILLCAVFFNFCNHYSLGQRVSRKTKSTKYKDSESKIFPGFNIPFGSKLTLYPSLNQSNDGEGLLLGQLFQKTNNAQQSSLVTYKSKPAVRSHEHLS